MRQSGRVNIVIVGAIIAALLIGYVILSGSQSPSEAGVRFMNALATGDYKTLADMSFRDGKSREDWEKQWKFSTEVGRYYRFRWQLKGASQSSDNNAAVRLWVWRNADSPSAYEENFQLPMVKEEGQWRVDVPNISREMFPALPR